MPTRKLLLLAMLVACAATFLHADTGVLTVNVRDSATSFAVRAKVNLKGPKNFSAVTGEDGSLRVTLPQGAYQMEISAAGYKPMTFQQSIGPGNNLAGRIMLDPVEPPQELRGIDVLLKPGFTLLLGYAVDERGQPVPAVHVHVEAAKLDLDTDQRGFFSVSVPLPDTPPDTQPTDTVVAAKPGYKTVIYRHVALESGKDWGVFLVMKRGTGEENFDSEPHWRE